MCDHEKVIAVSKPPIQMPTLSVVVPVYNSTAYLKKCLAALAESDYDDFDVLVVDDGSTEPVAPIVGQYGFDYMRIDGPGGPARARNRGVARVKGKYLVFIDADVCVHRDTLHRFAEVFNADSGIDAVVGSYDETPAEPGFFSQYKNLFHHYVHQTSGGYVNTFWSGCGAMRRDLFLAFGGFDEERYRRPAIEDIELGTWVTAAGYQIVLAPHVKATHLKRWTLWSILKTDILDRGVPWIKLMLRAGAAASTLNAKSSQRLSVALTWLASILLPVVWWWPAAGILSLLLLSVVSALNFDFYRYFIAHSGVWFTVRVLPLHWLYFWYCGLCVIWGTLAHYLETSGRSQAPNQENTNPKPHAE
ncbi:MAG: glycosyltransferase [Acidobacteria bacterium]|nr:glycosyltransferase [Acidobacteriota bacterium]